MSREFCNFLLKKIFNNRNLCTYFKCFTFFIKFELKFRGLHEYRLPILNLNLFRIQRQRFEQKHRKIRCGRTALVNRWARDVSGANF